MISIIALLVALLLPALGRARESAMRVSCASSIRQCMTSLHAYAADSKQSLPDSGHINALNTAQNYDELDIYLHGVGGVRSGRATGMGLVYLGGYINADALFCPSETERGTSSQTARQRWFVTRNYNDLTTFRTAIVTNNYDAFGPSYLFRGQRWYGDSNPANNKPALLNGASVNRFDQYLYSFDAGALSKNPTAALLSDSFLQGTSVLGSSQTENAINFHHVDGLNVSYADGHGEWVPDANRQIGLLTATVGVSHNIGSMTNNAEDIWDALDGDVGFQAVNYVSNLK